MYRKLIVSIITIAVMFTMTFSTGFVYADDAADSTKPEGIPIYTAEELLALEDEDGTYYLANDIDLKDYPNSSVRLFSGILDGNGYAIKNFTVDNSQSDANYNDVPIIATLFHGSSCSIKNLKMENVHINCTINDKQHSTIAALASPWGDYTFENISVSGDMHIKIKGEHSVISTCGMLYDSGNPFGKIKNCTSDMNITCEVLDGKISDLIVEGMGAPSCDSEAKTSGCKNTGDIKIIVHGNAKVNHIECYGLFFHREPNMNNLVSCGNTGNISIENYGKLKGSLYAGGVTNRTNSISKCYNKGNINIKGRFMGLGVGGLLSGDVSKVSQSYNKGNISLEPTVKTDEHIVWVTGIAGNVKKSIANSYNAGKITCSGKWSGGYVAGILGYCDKKCKITSCYNSGKITMPSGAKYGSIMYWKNGVLKNNYFRRGKAFISGTAKSSQAKKVDAISKKNCSGLSSDYWTYSKSKKRMILKKNKEV